MGFAGAMRNGLSVGLGSIIAFLSGRGDVIIPSSLLTENGDYLVQEDDGLILLE